MNLLSDSGKNQFLQTIHHLHSDERVVLFVNEITMIGKKQETDVLEFLEIEYGKEALDYPYQAPDYDGQTAVWASKVVCYASQLLLIRGDTKKYLSEFFPDYEGKMEAQTMLSADLCLRFLPDILKELRIIDLEDPLIPVLEKILKKFHYSAIGFSLDFNFGKTEMALLASNDCLRQLYVDRIIERKDYKLAHSDVLNPWICAALGNYKNEYWREFELK